MKAFFYLFAIFLFVVTGCTEKSKTSVIKQDDSICVEKEKVKEQLLDNEKKVGINEKTNENMIEIEKYFSSDELDKLRYNFVRQLRCDYWRKNTIGEIRILEEDNVDVGDRSKDPENIEITDLEMSENMDYIYRILLKKYPIFKPVSKELFEEKMKSVFGIDVKDRKICNSSFFTNFAMHSDYGVTYMYSTYIDFNNRIITLGELPLLFNKEADWESLIEGFEKKGIEYHSLEAFDVREKFQKDFLANALNHKYMVFCDKILLERLFHINNYVFYDNKASLSWLLSDDLGKVKLAILFEFFNYDKEPRINKYMMDIFFKQVDVIKGYPLNTNQYESLFGEVRTCPQTDYYNHFKFKVRTGLMQYIVDNCYDEEDLDDCGLKKDKYICVMEDCFDYLFKFVLQGDKYKESENCHYYQVCAYLAYYLQKAYDSYLSHNDGEPRCWHNALANNLYQDLRNNDGRFEKYVKDNNYFNLDGFDQIMEDAHEQAMR